MRRLLPLTLAFLVACNGGPGGIALVPGDSANATSPVAHHHRAITATMQMSIPRRHHHRTKMHPGTISPSTQSVSIAINGATPLVFNTTASSKSCAATSTATVCIFKVLVYLGKNTFVVRTYSGTNATGYILDQITAVRRITASTGAIGMVLGPVISNTNDSGPGSLRQALVDANAGDTLTYIGTTPATISVTGGAIPLAKNVIIAGPGASKLTIDAGNASQIFTVNASVTATISGVTIAHGNSAANGGAITNAGTLTLSDDAFSSSTAATAGGAIDNSGVLSSTSDTYSGNTALDGGAIDNTGSLTVTSDTFTGNNTVGSGVGPSIVIASRPVRAPRQPRVKRSRVRGVRHAPPVPKEFFPPSRMRPHPVAAPVPDGGAIYNGTAGTIAVTTSSFSGNGALQGTGGAIFDARTASGWTIANDTFTSNTAAYGGAVAVDTAGTLDTDTFTTNTGYPGNGALIVPYGYGAGVYASAALTVNNCTFSGNVAGGGTQARAFGYGGAIEADNAALTVSGSTFTNNIAGGTNSSGSSGQGGAIDTTSTSTFAVSITNSTFTSNTAGGGSAGTSFGYGGAIDTESNNTLAINGSTFTSNTAGGDGYGNGGAIIAQGAITGANDTFKSNAATGTSASTNVFGGAIDTNSTINLSGSTFSQNTATGGNGPITAGGAINTTNTLTIDSSTFTSNAASGPGAASVGGGAIQGTSGMTITNSTFTSNSATTGATGIADGGGVYDPSSAVTISGTTFTSNAVTGGSGSLDYGGAAECDSPGTTLTNDTFSKNSVTGTGTLTDVYGGALYLIGTSTISNGTFSQNTATVPTGAGNLGEGGAVNGGTVTFTGSITGNTATNQGGGIEVGGLTMTNSTVSGNSVTNAAALGQPTPDGGGGLYLVGARTSTISTSTISGNSVAGSGTGGGILNTSNSSPGTLNLTNDTIANNTSAVDGGGLEDLGSVSSLQFVTLYGNKATSGNGGNWNDATTPTSPDSFANTIAGGGSAGTSGQDIYNGGTINSGDYNIIQTAVGGTTLAGTTTHNQTANPLLSALANNGGPTQTMANSSSSPGYNTIPVVSASCNNTGVTTDQRGNARPGGHTNCDAGAYQFP